MPRHLADKNGDDEVNRKKAAYIAGPVALAVIAAVAAKYATTPVEPIETPPMGVTVATAPHGLPSVATRLDRGTVDKAPSAPAPTVSVVATKKPVVPAPVSWRVKVVDEGEKLFGVPYVWGGTTTKGFDCSGYTRYVYRKAGITIPRVAHDQMRAMKKTTNPKPGDLVFFLDATGHAYHVGIYVSKGYMYVAPHRGAVVRKERIWSKHITYRTPRNTP